MDTRRRPTKPPRTTSSQDGVGHHLHQKRLPPSIDNRSPSPTPKASDALPLPLYLTNAIFFTLFFSVAYYLLHRWREKIRNSTPLHVVTFPEIAAIVSLMASFIYLLCFFGIDFVQSFITRSSHDAWELEGSDNPNFLINKDHRLVTCPTPANIAPVPKSPNPDPVITPSASVEDEEIVKSVTEGTLPSYSLEAKLGDCKRAAKIRREALQRTTGRSLEGLPIEGFDYDSILGQCCEMPVGYVQIPVGVAGPLMLNGMEFMVPMATTEGCLVASTNRGCKAIYASGGASSVLYADGMTRAPVVRFETAKRASELKLFLEAPDNSDTLSIVFNRSSRFGRLQGIQCAMAGKNLYIRFKCSTGDAMGMNMVSKGVQNVLDFLQTDFPDMEVIGLSGNYCSDKKPAAVNWIGGRGKSVVCEAIIKEEIVKKVLKTSVASLVELNMLKNLAGSAIAGSLGGFNAHASNIVSAIFIATGQDPAQNVESSNCITMMEAVNDGKDLHVSVTMPSIEVGTVGGWNTTRISVCLPELTWCQGCEQRVSWLQLRALGQYSGWFSVSWGALSNGCHCTRAACQESHEIQQIEQRYIPSCIFREKGVVQQ
ncbi:3-HYDROXY-3-METHYLGLUTARYL COENZYME A REDUCTASE [Salix viminalis]|uniref:3-hydroxy-3-methylglutaryl coenzyme A reductase n=1 Tax=Salix viminalis TaxID=40686 RepID=A0A9Q0ZJ50_SALVM|nr:3-HYDROXY-3-METHYLGLUTARYL COENZYME A REDUCTASE [Salix viminalis]